MTYLSSQTVDQLVAEALDAAVDLKVGGTEPPIRAAFREVAEAAVRHALAVVPEAQRQQNRQQAVDNGFCPDCEGSGSYPEQCGRCDAETLYTDDPANRCETCDGTGEARAE